MELEPPDAVGGWGHRSWVLEMIWKRLRSCLIFGGQQRSRYQVLVWARHPVS
jgi:hypothetical protein